MKDLKLGFHSFDIESALENVRDSHFILPALQRGFVWKELDIEKLFDSIYKGYPFGSLLILKINGSKDKDITTFYKFTQNADSKHLFGNGDRYPVKDNDTKYCILDGQQRLTAIYRGIYLKIGASNINKSLYFNALSTLKDDYCFKYGREDNYYEADKLYIKVNSLWEEGSLLINNKVNKPNIETFVKKYIEKIPSNDWYKQNQKTLKNSNLIKNYKQLVANLNLNIKNIVDNIARFIETFKTKSLINYHMIVFENMTKEEKIERMLNIFIRLNNGGHTLKPANLLYSQIATYTNGEELEVRQKFDDYISQLNNVQNGDAEFKLDHFIRLLWLIVGGTASFKNFYASNAIQKYCNTATFDKVYESLVKARNVFIDANFRFVGKDGYNMFLPIAYYFYYKPKTTPKQDEQINHEIAKYYEISLLTSYFSGHSDSALIKVKKAFSNDSNNELNLFDKGVFDLKELQNKLNSKLNTTEKPFALNDSAIDSLLNLNYEKDGLKILNLLYVLDRKWIILKRDTKDIDHMHPKKYQAIDLYKKIVGNLFTNDKYQYFVNNYNLLPNLQLLDINVNRADKNDLPLFNWLKKNYTKTNLINYCDNNYISNDNSKIKHDYFKLENFETFFNTRKEQLKKKIEEVLG